MHLVAFKADTAPADTTPPTCRVTAPANGATRERHRQRHGRRRPTTSASTGVQFQVDGVRHGADGHGAPYALAWDTRDGRQRRAHAARPGRATRPATRRCRRRSTSTSRTRTRSRTRSWRPASTCRRRSKFLPDGRMLVAELQGKIKVLSPPYTTPDPDAVPADHQRRRRRRAAGDLRLRAGSRTSRPTTTTTSSTRWGRRTATECRGSPPTRCSPARCPGSELVLYQDPQDANAEHHGGALNFGNDGKLYFTTGEHFDPAAVAGPHQPARQDPPHQPGRHRPDRQPVLRRRRPELRLDLGAAACATRTAPTTTPPTGRLFIGDVGGNDASTAIEEVNVGARGANYGWPNVEGPCASPCTSPIYSYPHNGRDAAVTGRLRLPRHPVPERATRAATSSPTTPRTGSSA